MKPDLMPGTSLGDALAAIAPLDRAAMAAARSHLDRLTKPPGSLGRLEDVVVWLAGVTAHPAPPVSRRRIVVAAADHGVASARAVSAWPPEVTAQMVATFLRGRAAVSAIARLARAEVVVLDVGVATAITTLPAGDRGDGATLVATRVRAGTADIADGPAMTRAEAEAAIATGLEAARTAAAGRVDLLGVGEMGIGNSTAASAVVAAMTGLPPEVVTGRGTGVDDRGLARKIAAVERALAVNAPDSLDPVGVLAGVGGLEIAALVGLLAGAAAMRIPVLLDGFITGAAALVAAALEPGVVGRVLASHRSSEPGHAIVLERLGLRPLLELDLRLGEASGAALAMLLVEAAVRIRDEMATFEDAGVADRLPNRLA